MAAIGLVGFAGQRGGICTVHAIQDLVFRRRAGRLVSMVEASVWVGGGLVLLEGAGLLLHAPHGYRAGVSTVVGGALLGVGAFVNGACAFGTIGRIPAGHWAFLAMPMGFLLGAFAVARMFVPAPLGDASIVLVAASWLMVACMPLMGARALLYGIALRRKRASLRTAWSPHLATTVMGLAFLVACATLGSWAYTETLVTLARGNASGPARNVLLACALLAGAIAGGWSGGTFRHTPPTIPVVVRCLAGGGLMGAGASLIPGGSDALVLVGMPLLWPYAWLAFASMCATIYAACRLSPRP
jgi:toxin CptA